MATKSEVVGAALRRLGILSVDETVSADQIGYCGDVLDALLSELQSLWGVTFSWTVATVPAAGFLPLSYLLAAEVAPHYMVNPPETPGRSMARFRAYALPDDRDDRRDTNDDGIVSADEETAGLATAFY